MERLIQSIFDNVIEGDSAQVRIDVQTALDEGLPVDSILNQGLIAPMTEVGARFERNEFFVPEMLVSARAMQNGLAVLKPLVIATGIVARGKVVLGTVQGDVHDIGKGLVGMMLEGAGFEVVDIGSDAAPEQFAEAVREYAPQIVGMSALLTTTMPNMKSTIQTLQALGLRGGIKIMIGGAPVTEQYALDIGANGYAPDASRAVALANTFMKQLRDVIRD
jgi:5-methyltetrahydrofolate--homocysteine methyltransferase